jgi:predicted transposase/invertase (TIGR01784 family)
MTNLNNPHDSFFQETFGRKEIAADFLDKYLPNAIKERVNLETLTICKDSFVDKELRNHFSDILYTVKQNVGAENQNIHIYLLFEHKSYPDPWVSLQLLRYLIRIWEYFRKQNPKIKKLPLVVPLVLYHGRDNWQIPNNFRSLFTDEGGLFADYIPDFTYQLYDLPSMPDEQVRGEAMGRAILLLLKYIFTPRLHDKLPKIINLLNDIQETETALEVLEIMLRYVVKTNKDYGEKDINNLLSQANIDEDIMKTFIDKYIEQGMQQGVQQGMQQGQYKIVSAMLNNRFGKLPKWVYEKLDNADHNTLEKWSIKLLSAKKLDEVFH